MEAKLRKTVSLHRGMMDKRMGMRELRTKLGHQREEELLLRVALMKDLNAFCVLIDCGRTQQDVQQMQNIELGHEELESAVNAYIKLEQTYDVEEYELRKHEDELDEAMECLLSWMQKSGAAEGSQYHHDNDQNIDINDSEKKDDDEEYKDDEMFAEDMHPLMVEYLQRTGDIEIHEEHLEEVEGEYEDILHKKVLWDRVNVPLDEESQKFLSSYKEKHEKAQKALDTTIQEANQLHELCKLEGLLHEATEDTTANNDNTNNKNTDNDEISLSQVIQNHQHSHPDPLKVTAKEDTHPFSESQTTTTTSKSNRSTFINKWLLHQLRHSSLQISRFKSAPELRGISASVISQWVLDFWFMDDDIMEEPPVSP